MVTISFDKDCSAWDPNREYNMLFLQMQKSFINEKLESRGYIYLNEIYESIGAKWNSYHENICYRRRKEGINMWFEPSTSGGILINIK